MSNDDPTILEASPEDMRDGFERKKSIQQIGSQMADIMGELDGIAKESGPENRIRALSTKLRHLENRRHHEESLVVEGVHRDRMLASMETISETCNLWLREQKKVQPHPGHTSVSFRAMGINVQASGKEDDPLFQKIANTIEQISVEVTKLRETAVIQNMEEERLDGEDRRSHPSDDEG